MNRIRRLNFLRRGIFVNGNPYHDKLGRFAEAHGGNVSISSYIADGPKTPKKALENLKNSSKYAESMVDYFEYELTKTKEPENLIKTINSFANLIEETKKIGVDVDNIMFSVSNIGMTEEIGGTCSTFEIEPGKIGGSYVQLNEDLDFESSKETFYKYDGSKDIEKREWRVADSPLSTLRHEIGHAVANQIMNLSSTVWEDHNHAQEEIVEAATGKKLPEFVGECIQQFEISEYGATSAGEMIAESWCNPNYSEDTRKIYDYLVSEISKIKKQENKLRKFEKVQLCSGCPKKKIKIENANPYHDKLGRFTEGPGGAKSTFSEFESKHAELREDAKWTKEEISKVSPYFGISDFEKVQEYMRGGDDVNVGKYKASEVAQTLLDKLEKTRLKEDVTLYRAICIRNDRVERVENNSFSSPVFQSASLKEMNAMNVVMGYMTDEMFSEFNEIALLKINAKKGAKALASYTNGELEVVLPPESIFKIKNKKDKIAHIEYEVDYE